MDMESTRFQYCNFLRPPFRNPTSCQSKSLWSIAISNSSASVICPTVVGRRHLTAEDELQSAKQKASTIWTSPQRSCPSLLRTPRSPSLPCAEPGHTSIPLVVRSIQLTEDSLFIISISPSANLFSSTQTRTSSSQSRLFLTYTVHTRSKRRQPNGTIFVDRREVLKSRCALLVFPSDDATNIKEIKSDATPLGHAVRPART